MVLGIEPLMESNIKSVLNQLMPALLQLASGSDLVAKQLFHLQVLQLMHWYSSRQMQGRAQTEAVLIAIWVSVVGYLRFEADVKCNLGAS